MMVAAAVIGGSVASAAIGSSASRSAASAQSSNSTNALYNQMLMEAQNQGNALPYMQGGAWAEQEIKNRMFNGTIGGQYTPDSFAPTSPGNSTFTNQDYLNNVDPGYQFQLNQGQQALQNSQAAQNGVLSGAALKSLIGYNQDYASTGYQNAYNRWLNTYNANQSAYQNSYSRWLNSQQNSLAPLQGLANLGGNVAVGAGTNNVSSANGVSNALTNIGNAQAAGTVGSANAINSAISNGTGYYMLNGMLNGGGSNGGSPTDANGYALSNYASGGSASGVTPYL